LTRIAVPLPSPEEADYGPPTNDEISLIFGAIVTAAAHGGELTQLQSMLCTALCEAMTGFVLDPNVCDRFTASELAQGVARRDALFRTRIVQNMVLVAMLVRPFSDEAGQRIDEYATALNVDDEFHREIRHFGPRSYDSAIVDFARNGYAGEFLEHPRPVLHTDRDIGDGWQAVVDDPVLAQTWADLEQCPDGSLGRGVFDFYQSRHFITPGLPGSAPPLLAQHDWVHVVADYGTTLESELEVFGLIASADDDPRGFSLLAMVIGLFETGLVTSGAGLFEADTGHLSEAGMATRLADAMRRGALARPDGDAAKDLLGLDWFSYAYLPVEEVRERFQIPPKSAGAIAAGSVGTWDEAGFSAYQREHCDLSVLDRYQ
jgi:hypothetical protein